MELGVGRRMEVKEAGCCDEGLMTSQQSEWLSGLVLLL